MQYPMQCTESIDPTNRNKMINILKNRKQSKYIEYENNNNTEMNILLNPFSKQYQYYQ